MNPLVSVCVITYNQEKYIPQTLDGILSQKANFNYEIVLGEDCSTDGTRRVCIEYQKKHPDKIKLLLREKNIGMMSNFFETLNSCTGKYIAICEGDDYWIDENKLQKQVDFLENNIEYGVVFTDADHLYEDSGKIIRAYDRTFRRKIPVGDVFKDLLYGNPYKTCTSLFKNDLIHKKFPLLLKFKFKIGDKILWFLIAGKSKVGYLSDNTSVYRIRSNSASHFTKWKQELTFIHSGYKMSVFFADFYCQYLDKKKLKRHFKEIILSTCIQKGYYRQILKYCDNPLLVIKILIKEKILRKLLLGFG